MLSDPKLIRQIHADYCQAGADVLTTNTFGANRVALANFGLAEKLAEIVRAGAPWPARPPTPLTGRYVAGSIGPLSRPGAAPRSQWTLLKMRARRLDRRAGRSLDGGWSRLHPLRNATEPCGGGAMRAAMGRLPNVPFALSFVIADQNETASGESVERMMAPLPPGIRQPIAWGMNCGSGPDGLLAAR